MKDCIISDPNRKICSLQIQPPSSLTSFKFYLYVKRDEEKISKELLSPKAQTKIIQKKLTFSSILIYFIFTNI